MPQPTEPSSSTLAAIRGSLPRARANARSIAALTDNPGCARRRVIEAAGVKAFELAERLGHPVTRGQSPFAIATGNQFERRLKEGSHYKLLIEALQPFISIPESPRIADLGTAKGVSPGEQALLARAARTEKVLESIAGGKTDAPHIVDHPVLNFDVAGTSVFLEPDALAFRAGTKLELVEIKSYPIIDGQADPSKLAATGGQAAVYLLAIRAVLKRLGFDPDMLQPSVILVAPRNFGRAPTAHRVSLKKKAMALERVLNSIPRTATLLEHLNLPKDYSLDVQGDALSRAVRFIPMLYVPECLAACDMARYCRHQAIADGCPSQLGRSARDNLAGVATLHDALRLATHAPRPTERHLEDVAQALADASRALERARQKAGLGVPPVVKKRGGGK